MTATIQPATDAGTLLERADALAYLNRCIAEATEAGEIEDGVLPDYLAELVALAEQDLRTKMERLHAVHRRKATEIAVIDAQLAEAKAEVARLAGRKTTRENEQARIKRYAWLCLDAAGETKIETPTCTVRIQKNGGAPAIRWVGAPDALPEAFRQPPTPPALNVEQARTYLKTHGTLPDGFDVTTPGYSLRFA